MIDIIQKKFDDLVEQNSLIKMAITHLPLALEILATIWVVFYFSFEPIIPVYQGY